MFNKKTIKDMDFQGKKALVRVDFNVPLKNGVITDDTRVVAALPTIQYLLAHGAAVILCSHLGRPKTAADLEYSMRPVAEYLGTLVKVPVHFAEDCIGPVAEAAASSLKMGEVLVLENTRFHPEETKNDEGMSRALASLADIFVNDAFGSAHRAHSSTVGVADYLPACAGFLLEKEIEYLDRAIEDPKRPFVAILGGAKISDKIGVIKNLLAKADTILIGGGMANTFLKAKGYEMGDSLVEADAIETAASLIAEGGSKLILPVDMVLADAFDNNALTRIVEAGDVPAGWRCLDIGPKSIALFSELVAGAGTVVWNGPMGVFEMPNFAKGTFEVAKAVAESKAISIIGGGDSASAINQSGLADKISHISTGGGASLEMLEGIILPGLAALADR
ncbi:MAG: phosphoglycerate kinase [Anaerolineae bacterium]|nr:phosphoglycerate kinase [Anaerolineae bacterium]